MGGVLRNISTLTRKLQVISTYSLLSYRPLALAWAGEAQVGAALRKSSMHILKSAVSSRTSGCTYSLHIWVASLHAWAALRFCQFMRLNVWI